MTLYQSVCGTSHEPTARNKFAIFALVACLLVPNAARQLRSTIRHEKMTEKFEMKEGRLPRVIQRYSDSGRRAGKKLDALVETLTDRWLFPNNHATADSIAFTRPPFPAPHYSGDAPPYNTYDVPEGLVAVSHEFSCEFPSASYLLDLVHKYGYDIDAALSCLTRAHLWRNSTPDRRKCGGHPTADNQMNGEYANPRFSQPAHPYNPSAPNRRTHHGGGFSRSQVLASVARMRTSHNVRLACFEVVYRRRVHRKDAEMERDSRREETGRGSQAVRNRDCATRIRVKTRK
jgi:hypothetical protein